MKRSQEVGAVTLAVPAQLIDRHMPVDDVARRSGLHYHSNGGTPLDLERLRPFSLGLMVPSAR
jgi:hypothetical protein